MLFRLYISSEKSKIIPEMIKFDTKAGGKDSPEFATNCRDEEALTNTVICCPM
jgi:hypothetical protein